MYDKCDECDYFLTMETESHKVYNCLNCQSCKHVPNEMQSAVELFERLNGVGILRYIAQDGNGDWYTCPSIMKRDDRECCWIAENGEDMFWLGTTSIDTPWQSSQRVVWTDEEIMEYQEREEFEISYVEAHAEMSNEATLYGYDRPMFIRVPSPPPMPVELLVEAVRKANGYSVDGSVDVDGKADPDLGIDSPPF